MSTERMQQEERERESRKRKLEQSLQTTPSPSNETAKTFRSRQTLSKAVSRVKVNLPFSPRKKRTVVSAQAQEYQVFSDTNNQIKNPQAHSITPETKENVEEFYLRTDISYTMPGMKDFMCIWDAEGKKTKLTKHYMNMYVREAYALYKEEFSATDFSIKMSSFYSLRPANVLLLTDTE